MNTEALTALKERRSTRSFKPQQVTDAELEAVLEAGIYAPSGQGKQARVIVAVQNKEDIAALSRMNAAIMGKDIDPYYGAPTILLVLARSDSVTPVEDGCAATTYLLAAAHAAGLGACWINRERQIFDSAEGKALLKKWGLPEDCVGIAACALGYREGDSPAPAPRREGNVVRVK